MSHKNVLTNFILRVMIYNHRKYKLNLPFAAIILALVVLAMLLLHSCLKDLSYSFDDVSSKNFVEKMLHNLAPYPLRPPERRKKCYTTWHHIHYDHLKGEKKCYTTWHHIHYDHLKGGKNVTQLGTISIMTT